MNHYPLKQITKKEADKTHAKTYYFKGKYFVFDWDKWDKK